MPRHEKKENQQLSPVKKRVKESSPPHQHRYNRTSHVSPKCYCAQHNGYNGQNGGAIVSSASSSSKCYCGQHSGYNSQNGGINGGSIVTSSSSNSKYQLPLSLSLTWILFSFIL